MFRNSVTLLGVSALATTVLGDSQIDNGASNKESKYLRMGFDKYAGGKSFESAKRGAKPFLANRLSKRGYQEYVLANENTFYSVGLSIGTPAQLLTVLLDTGSSDLWVMETCSDTACTTYGSFDSSASSTFSNNDTEFYATYGGDTYSSGTWGYDTVSIDQYKVGKLSFGVASTNNAKIGVLGIGLPELESTYSGMDTSETYEYANLPMVLKESGVIDKTLFSLYLDQPVDDSGTLLFGAVDVGKVSGELYTLPMINIYADDGFSEPAAYEVTLQGMGVSSSSSQTTITTTKFAVLLDSGTTLMVVPSSLMPLIADALDATYDSSVGYYSISTSAENRDLVFDFGGFHINVPLSDLIISSSSGDAYLGMVTSSSQFIVLGDVFLTSAYVVFDLDDYEISLGQADYSGDSDIVEVSNSIPGAVRAESYYNTWTAYADAVAGGNIFTLEASSTSFSSSSASTTPTATSTISSTTESSSTSSSSTTSTTSSTTLSTTDLTTSNTETSARSTTKTSTSSTTHSSSSSTTSSTKTSISSTSFTKSTTSPTTSTKKDSSSSSSFSSFSKSSSAASSKSSTTNSNKASSSSSASSIKLSCASATVSNNSTTVSSLSIGSSSATTVSVSSMSLTYSSSSERVTSSSLSTAKFTSASTVSASVVADASKGKTKSKNEAHYKSTNSWYLAPLYVFIAGQFF